MCPAIEAAKEQPWLVQLPAVQVLRKVWVDQYVEEDGQLRWRSKAEMPAPASQVSSPYDPAARYSTKLCEISVADDPHSDEGGSGEQGRKPTAS